MIGTRYAIAVVRFLVDFSNNRGRCRAGPRVAGCDLSSARNTLALLKSPIGMGQASGKGYRRRCYSWGTTVSDTRRMFGANDNDVDPVRHLIGSCHLLWGGNPEKDALYLPITPARND